ncbi:hypothetical protein J6590_004832 [Homalodisca vitripennis]|nr:hypothetical protein J6590_004832 [Homalodisca vitripennis]
MVIAGSGSDLARPRASADVVVATPRGQFAKCRTPWGGSYRASAGFSCVTGDVVNNPPCNGIKHGNTRDVSGERFTVVQNKTWVAMANQGGALPQQTRLFSRLYLGFGAGDYNCAVALRTSGYDHIMGVGGWTPIHGKEPVRPKLKASRYSVKYR